MMNSAVFAIDRFGTRMCQIRNLSCRQKLLPNLYQYIRWY